MVTHIEIICTNYLEGMNNLDFRDGTLYSYFPSSFRIFTTYLFNFFVPFKPKLSPITSSFTTLSFTISVHSSEYFSIKCGYSNLSNSDAT